MAFPSPIWTVTVVGLAVGLCLTCCKKKSDDTAKSRTRAAVVRDAGPSKRDTVSGTRVRKAVFKGIAALCRFPEKDLRHDTAMSLALVNRLVSLERFTGCLKKINKRALRDHDHPLNFMIVPSWRRADPAHIKGLPIPKAGQKRTNVNHLVFRAAYCRRVKFSKEAFAYVTGPMRDNGGFHSTHALWALQMLRENGCESPEKLDPAIASLTKELLSAQKKGLDLNSTRSVDLYAERILFLARSGVSVRVLTPFVSNLLRVQRSDGLFAAPGEKESRWLVHSTTVSVWALSRFLAALGSAQGR